MEISFMEIIIDKKTEDTLINLAKNLNLNPQTLVKNAINEYIENHKNKKIEEISSHIANAYNEMIEAKRSNKELLDAWKLLNEL